MKQFNILVILFFAFYISSCSKEESQPTGVGDVLIVTKKSGTNTVYGLSFYAYTFSSFQSVKAVNTTVPDKIYTLKSNQDYKTNFLYETPDAEFTASKPTAATYNFSAVFENGATHEFQDILSDKALSLPVIEKCEYNATKRLLEVSWATLTDADSYAINILDGSTVVFGSAELPNTVKAYSISANGGGWLSGFTPKRKNLSG
ncbi:MAG TPA: hypothetical protein DCR40_20780 [Prolixibacteraceae bacterium]|nr:hypothetical protein [Prolixibacteraceae bacterium]